MSNRSRLALLVAACILVVAGACRGTSTDAPADATPGGDLTLLVRLGDLARQRVEQMEPGATLQQVDVLPGDGRYEFRFSDPTLVRVVLASGAVDARTPEAFTATPGAKLASAPGAPVELEGLRIGPDGVVAAAVQELSAASPRSLVLARQDGRLIWRVVVNGPQGIVSGTVPDDTGRFVRDAP